METVLQNVVVCVLIFLRKELESVPTNLNTELSHHWRVFSSWVICFQVIFIEYPFVYLCVYYNILCVYVASTCLSSSDFSFAFVWIISSTRCWLPKVIILFSLKCYNSDFSDTHNTGPELCLHESKRRPFFSLSLAPVNSINWINIGHCVHIWRGKLVSLICCSLQ